MHRLYVPGDGPDEGRHFTGYGGDDDGLRLAAGGESAIAGAETQLRFPCDFVYRLGQAGKASLVRWPDPRGRAVGPGAFDQHAARTLVPSLCDATTMRPCAGRVFGRDQSEIAHELTRVIETAKVAGFRSDRNGGDEADAAHGLNGFDPRRQRPTRQRVRYLRLQSGEPYAGIVDKIYRFLQHDPMRRLIERKRRQPTPMFFRPVLATAKDPILTEEKTLQLLTGPAEILHRCRSQPDQVAHRLVRFIGNPDSGKFGRTMQPCQCYGVTTVGLHPVTGTSRSE